MIGCESCVQPGRCEAIVKGWWHFQHSANARLPASL